MERHTSQVPPPYFADNPPAYSEVYGMNSDGSKKTNLPQNQQQTAAPVEVVGECKILSKKFLENKE